MPPSPDAARAPPPPTPPEILPSSCTCLPAALCRAAVRSWSRWPCDLRGRGSWACSPDLAASPRPCSQHSPTHVAAARHHPPFTPTIGLLHPGAIRPLRRRQNLVELSSPPDSTGISASHSLVPVRRRLPSSTFSPGYGDPPPAPPVPPRSIPPTCFLLTTAAISSCSHRHAGKRVGGRVLLLTREVGGEADGTHARLARVIASSHRPA
jgi:hypothetical protein